MTAVTLVCVGSIKEGYLREGIAEYTKRLSAFCDFRTVELKESRTGDGASEREIDAALDEEGTRILAALDALSPRTHRIALCVEGKQLDSVELSRLIAEKRDECGSIALVIGSSCGLSPKVKAACHTRLSVSRLTFPHQLMRFVLTEILYRSMMIDAGRKYHK